MANIIITSSSNIIWTEKKQADPFVQGMIDALKRAGNRILNIVTNDCSVRGISLIHESPMAETLKAFKPDLIITLNNVFPYIGILDDIDCPVACFAADSCAFFSNQELIKKYADRYHFFNFSNDTIEPFYKWFPYVDKNRVHLFGHVTDMCAKAIPQDINISFIGSIATWNKDFTNYFKSLAQYNLQNRHQTNHNPNQIKNDFFVELDRFKNAPHSEFSKVLPHFDPQITGLTQAAILLLTAKDRIDVLTKMTDLGLTIFGYPEVYSDLLIYNYDLFRCFDFTPNATMEDTVYNYNRSKISLNLPHAHTKEGLSWRVCDILASNAVLLSCKQPDLVQMTKGYVDLPMYESASEARDLSVKLLKDDIWRSELSAGCQRMIDEKYRFETKFTIIEQAIPTLTLFPTEGNGKVDHIDPQYYQRKIRTEIIKAYKNFKKPQKTPQVYQPKKNTILLLKDKIIDIISDKKY